VELREAFNRFSSRSSALLGSPGAFIGAFGTVLATLWLGPLYFPKNWIVIISTGATVATFLVVFILQNAQNREMKSVQLKLDELIRVLEGARNSLIHAESISDRDRDELKRELTEIRNSAEPASVPERARQPL
jgi:low affinity Fe/Cu permease